MAALFLFASSLYRGFDLKTQEKEEMEEEEEENSWTKRKDLHFGPL